MYRPVFAFLIVFLPLTFVFADSFEQEEFDRNGFVVLKNFFDEAHVAAIASLASKAEEEGDSHRSGGGACDVKNSEAIVVFENENPDQLCRVENLSVLDKEIYDRLVEAVSSQVEIFAGEAYVPFKDKINLKYPGGGAFPAHQDYPAYRHFEPQVHVTAMLSVDIATEENGCLFFAEDWTKAFEKDAEVDQKLLSIGRAIIPNTHDGILPKYADRLSWKLSPTGKADLVLFNSYVPHRSFKNLSDKSRRAIFITFSPKRSGDFKTPYYELKSREPNNPMFHHATPTKTDDAG